MALGKLQLIRQDMLRVRAESGSSTAGGQVPAQQIERYKRWADSFNMSENCRDLSSDVTAVQDQSRDIVFARQVLLGTQINQQQWPSGSHECRRRSPNSCECCACKKALKVHHSRRHVTMAVVRVIVSGCGIRLGKDYIFPEMTPVAIAYLWQKM